MATVVMDEMLCNVIIWMCVTLCLTSCTTDFCSWTGSGFAEWKEDPRLVLQVRLRCAAGWVRWVYPGQQALRVVLEPNLFYVLRSTVCIKPFPSLCGANVFIERAGQLKLLVTEQASREEVMCFRADEAHGPVIYLQTRVQSEEPWGRCTTGFRYEVLTNRRTAASLDHRGLEESCRPCNNTELLEAICNSDFVVRGFIKNISHDSVRQISSVQVSLTRVYRQHSSVFKHHAALHRPSMSGNIYTLLQCHIKPGDGEFLFTGSEHFGRAWLGCAPRFKDFLSVYHSARAARHNPCDFPLD